MVSILIEPSFSKSVWCNSLLKSLTDELRLRRIPFCEIFDSVPKANDGVFIIAANYNWIKKAITELNRYRIIPILICNQLESIAGCSYNCVCSDINGSMQYLLDCLKAEKKTRVALYGVNTGSISDVSRVDGLFALKGNHFETMKIFNNNGSLENCFKDFLPYKDEFDAVICTNDFAAISLLRNLQKYAPYSLEKIKIFSCAQTQFLKYFSDRITTINLNYEQYGKAAVFIYEKIKKQTYISNIKLSVKWNTQSNTSFYSGKDIRFKLSDEQDNFYEDVELMEMLTIERLLCNTDATDRYILRMIIAKQPLTDICTQCFLTENAIKYRIKKILNTVHLNDKNEVILLINKYLHPNCGDN